MTVTITAKTASEYAARRCAVSFSLLIALSLGVSRTSIDLNHVREGRHSRATDTNGAKREDSALAACGKTAACAAIKGVTTEATMGPSW